MPSTSCAVPVLNSTWRRSSGALPTAWCDPDRTLPCSPLRTTPRTSGTRTCVAPCSSRTALSPGGSESDRLMRAVMSSTGSEGTGTAASIYNTREPVQALANMESMTVEAVFILKDFHRHMDDPVVVRRLRDVGQKFSANRRTVIITCARALRAGGAHDPGRILRSAAA